MYDRDLIGKYLEREVEQRGSWSSFAAESRVSRATLYRMRDADPTVTVAKMRQAERALSLPFDTFQLVAVHDFGGLRELGLAGEVVGWLERQARDSRASAAPSTSRKRSERATSQE